MTTTHGQCLCGAISFEFDGSPKFCAHCHCSLCRRAHGAAIVTWTGVKLAKLRILDPTSALRHYASSPGVQRSFCGVCGSSLFFEAQRWPGEIHLASACITGGASPQPTAHVFFSDRAEWHALSDSLPKLGGESGVAPLKE